MGLALAPVEGTPYIGGNKPGHITVDADGNQQLLKNKLDATAAPTSGDDFDSGYAAGSLWVDVSNEKSYVCVSDGVWKETTLQTAPGGSDGQWQYNSSGSFAGDASIVRNGLNDITISGLMRISSATSALLGTHVLPDTDSAYNLGSDASRWASGYLDDLVLTTSGTVGDTSGLYAETRENYVQVANNGATRVVMSVVEGNRSGEIRWYRDSTLYGRLTANETVDLNYLKHPLAIRTTGRDGDEVLRVHGKHGLLVSGIENDSRTLAVRVMDENGNEMLTVETDGTGIGGMIGAISGVLAITNTLPASAPFTITGAPAQSADLFVAGDSSGNDLVTIQANGGMTFENTGHISWAKITADSITLVTGTSADAVADLQTEFDGNTYDLTEAADTPGQNLIVDFVNVKAFNWVRILGSYDGTATHEVSIQLYNWVTEAWDTHNSMQTDSGNNINSNYSFFVPEFASYVGTGANEGDVRVRFYHSMPGNASHDLYLDVVALYQ